MENIENIENLNPVERFVKVFKFCSERNRVYCNEVELLDLLFDAEFYITELKNCGEALYELAEKYCYGFDAEEYIDNLRDEVEKTKENFEKKYFDEGLLENFNYFIKPYNVSDKEKDRFFDYLYNYILPTFKKYWKILDYEDVAYQYVDSLKKDGDISIE